MPTVYVVFHHISIVTNVLRLASLYARARLNLLSLKALLDWAQKDMLRRSEWSAHHTKLAVPIFYISNRPRWANSGTVIGSIASMRLLYKELAGYFRNHTDFTEQGKCFALQIQNTNFTISIRHL